MLSCYASSTTAVSPLLDVRALTILRATRLQHHSRLFGVDRSMHGFNSLSPCDAAVLCPPGGVELCLPRTC